jgi:hypothetical protein
LVGFGSFFEPFYANERLSKDQAILRAAQFRKMAYLCEKLPIQMQQGTQTSLS